MEIKDVFTQANIDPNTIRLDTENHNSRILHGVKIIEDKLSGDIVILDTTRGGEYYKEITEEQYTFFQKGWRIGVYKTRLQVYKEKLNYIEQKIVDELNNKNNETQLRLLKQAKDRTIKNYFKLTQKLNQHEQISI